MDGIVGERAGGVMEIHVMVGNPARGMKFETVSKLVGELGGDIGGHVRVKDETIMKEGVLKVKDGRVRNGGRSRGKGGEGAGEGEKG